ncbi:hypothetical protein [Terrabacter terrigena]|uniref:Uncharacterized protein n=1 Tax=Terrabacter terrigena TaxID=574718 RepID=A0ABW3MT03_9MICO
MTTTIRPTRQAVRMHMSHLATTHRAPLVSRNHGAARTAGAARTRATAFTPMAPEGGTHEKPRQQVHTQIQTQIQTQFHPTLQES